MRKESLVNLMWVKQQVIYLTNFFEWMPNGVVLCQKLFRATKVKKLEIGTS